jgi:hypothetical protein
LRSVFYFKKRHQQMNKKLTCLLAMAGITCVLAAPVMAETSPGTTNNGTMMKGPSAPSDGKSTSTNKSDQPKGTNGAATQGTALPGSGGEAGSGGNSGFGNKTSSGAGSTDSDSTNKK